MPTETIKFYASEILVAIEMLHEKFILYRDLKPENVMLDKDGHVKLIDFGLAKILRNSFDKTNTQCGTPCYLAPELLVKNGHSYPIDIWAFGVVLFEMIAG
jgi:serine/threonine protein kinase